MKAKSTFFQLRRLFCLAVLGTALCSRAAAPFPAKIHAGAIERMERTSDPVIFVKLEEAMANDEVNPVDIVPEGLRAEIAPADGEVFLVFTIAIQADRSLSTLDYRLQAGGAEHECKGMALESNNAFDLRRVVQKGPAVVKLLFSCPATAEEATLINAFPDVPLTPTPTITLIEKTTPPPEPDAPEAKPEAEKNAPEAEKNAEAAPEAEKAAETDAENKNETAPEAAKATTEADEKTDPAAKNKKPAAKPAAKSKKTAAEAKPAEAKPAEAKPAEAKPAEAKPAEAKPAEAKPAEADAKPATKPAAKPAENVWF